MAQDATNRQAWDATWMRLTVDPVVGGVRIPDVTVLAASNPPESPAPATPGLRIGPSEPTADTRMPPLFRR